jgi:hypothetical protein
MVVLPVAASSSNFMRFLWRLVNFTSSWLKDWSNWTADSTAFTRASTKSGLDIADDDSFRFQRNWISLWPQNHAPTPFTTRTTNMDDTCQSPKPKCKPKHQASSTASFKSVIQRSHGYSEPAGSTAMRKTPAASWKTEAGSLSVCGTAGAERTPHRLHQKQCNRRIQTPSGTPRSAQGSSVHTGLRDHQPPTTLPSDN